MTEIDPQRFALLVQMARSAAASNPKNVLADVESPKATARWMRHEMIVTNKAPDWLLADDWHDVFWTAYGKVVDDLPSTKIADAKWARDHADDAPNTTPVTPLGDLETKRADRPRRCGVLRRRHIDVVADPSLPGRLVCTRCGKSRYRSGG